MTIKPKIDKEGSSKIDQNTFDFLGKNLDLTPSALQLFKEVAQSISDRKAACNMVMLENGNGGFVSADFKDGKFVSAESTPSTVPEISDMRSTFESAVKAKGNKGIEVRGDENLSGPRAVIVPACAP
jgi:hypothetical protein